MEGKTATFVIGLLVTMLLSFLGMFFQYQQSQLNNSLTSLTAQVDENRKSLHKQDVLLAQRGEAIHHMQKTDERQDAAFQRMVDQVKERDNFIERRIDKLEQQQQQHRDAKQ